MSDTTQGFMLGLSAALAGIMLYVCCAYGSALLLGAPSPQRTTARVEKLVQADQLASINAVETEAQGLLERQ